MKKIAFETDSIYVISDIHGGLNLLQDLLGKIKAGSILIILGDLIEKGKYSLNTLEYVINLSKLKNVYVVKGNNDEALLRVFSPDHLDYFVNRMNNKTSIVYEMIKLHGLKGSTQYMQHELAKKYSSQLNWLANLEDLIETDDFIFVHAGIDNIPDYHNSSKNSLTRLSNFYLKGHQSGKMVVCGHYPTANYHLYDFNDNIIIDEKKQIICLDGGYGAKTFGQLNMLEIIKDGANYQYKTYSSDDFPETQIVKSQTASGSFRGVCYPDYYIDIIREGKYFTEAKLANDEVVYVKNEFIEYINNKYCVTDDIPSNLLGVDVGDTVKVISVNTLGYALVKKAGVSGWVTYECLPDNFQYRGVKE